MSSYSARISSMMPFLSVEIDTARSYFSEGVERGFSINPGQNVVDLLILPFGS